MKTLSINLTAGQRLNFHLGGDYFHLLETTGPVDVDFLRRGAVESEARDMEFGFFAKPSFGFDELAFDSATTQTIKIAVGFGDGGYSRTTGSVQIIGQADTMAQTAPAVTNASGLLLAANASRKLLVVQNNDTVGNVFLNLAGAAATVAGGIKIEPGGSLILDTHLPASAIYAIGDIASNTKVVVVES